MANSHDEDGHPASAASGAASVPSDSLPRVALDWLREILRSEFPSDLDIGGGGVPPPATAEEEAPPAPPEP